MRWPTRAVRWRTRAVGFAVSRRGNQSISTGAPPDLTEVRLFMLLALALLLFLVFGGLGFVAHVLWWGLIVAVVIMVAHAITGRGSRV